MWELGNIRALKQITGAHAYEPSCDWVCKSYLLIFMRSPNRFLYFKLFSIIQSFLSFQIHIIMVLNRFTLLRLFPILVAAFQLVFCYPSGSITSIAHIFSNPNRFQISLKSFIDHSQIIMRSPPAGVKMCTSNWKCVFKGHMKSHFPCKTEKAEICRGQTTFSQLIDTFLNRTISPIKVVKQCQFWARWHASDSWKSGAGRVLWRHVCEFQMNRCSGIHNNAKRRQW